MKIIKTMLITSILVFTLIGCSPNENNEIVDNNALVMTAVKQTDVAQAHLTQEALPNETEPAQEPTSQPEPTETTPVQTAAPTITAAPTAIPATPTSSKPCLEMLFVEDVTIPDGYWITPGDPFTKTWTVRNTGSCNWDEGYQVEFDYGAQMGAPASFIVPETVYPGFDVDLSVDLVAPMTEGTFIGNFKLKSEEGIFFGTFYVQIYVPIPELADFSGDTLEITSSKSGSVDGAGNVTTAYAYAGDTVDDEGTQAFFQFDLSEIPDSADVNAIYLLIPSNSVVGDPFDPLGCMRVYNGTFFGLGAGDYGSGGTYRYITYCYPSDLDVSMYSEALTNYVGNQLATDIIDLKLSFYLTQSDDNGEADYVSLDDVRLLVYYTP